MRHCETTGFLGVIVKVSLCIKIRLVTDDLDCSLVGTNGTVGTKTPELALDCALRFSGDSFCIRQ